MRLDLHGVIGMPGRSAEFDYFPDTEGLTLDCVLGFRDPLRAVGRVRNEASVLHLDARLTALLDCECARCLAPLEKAVDLDVSVVLTDRAEDADDVEIVALEGDTVELDDILVSAFILSMDQAILCSEDCKGLCPRCGKNLNDGPCGCGPEPDPRLALLRQLLEKE